MTEPVAGVNGVDLVVEGLRALGPQRDLNAVQRLITTSAVESLPGVEHAALTVRVGERLRAAAATSTLAQAIDELQFAHGGPCVDAVTSAADDVGFVHAEDFTTENRWPAFVRAVVDRTPVRSALSYRLTVGHDDAESIGSLTVYATEPRAFEDETVTAGDRFAAYTAVVLAYATERDRARNLTQALHSSRDIGTAVGILMSRHLITRDQALDRLSSASQHTNRKLRDLADDVIRDGDLTVPGADASTDTPSRLRSRQCQHTYRSA